MKKKVQEITHAAEPMAVYGASTSLIGLLNYNLATSTDFDLLNLARKGISKKSLVGLARQISLTIQEVAGIMHISERTLQRYTPATLIKSNTLKRQ
jgi:hypothetical protein